MKTLKNEDLKKDLTEEEVNAVYIGLVKGAVAYAGTSSFRDYLTAKYKEDADALHEILQGCYISNSLENEAGAVWFPNETLTAAEKPFPVRAAALTKAGAVAVLVDVKNKNKLIPLDDLPALVQNEMNTEHEEKKMKRLKELNDFKTTSSELLPKLCAVLESYRGKRWGAGTLVKIHQDFREITPAGFASFISLSGCWLQLTIKKGYSFEKTFLFKFNEKENTPAEPVAPTHTQLDKLKPIDIKTHRKEIKKTIKEIQKTAEDLQRLLKVYTATAPEEVYKYRNEATRINLYRLTDYYLDD